MTRRCSACSGDGHSRRTCNSTKKQFKLFGVRLTPPDIIKKSASSGNISHHCSADDSPEGYHSDHGPFGSTRRQLHRKKGTPWTEEEHRKFLLGLQVLGKGDWRGISQNYIPSRTPSQVASHAQKYFIRQSEGPRRKRRPSLFDMDANTSSMQEQCSIPPPDASIDNQKLMNSSSQESNITNMHLFLDVSLKPVCMPSPFQLWPPTSPSFKDDNAGPSTHQIRGEPGIEHVGIGQLTLDETKLNLHVEPLPLSLRLPGEP